MKRFLAAGVMAMALAGPAQARDADALATLIDRDGSHVGTVSFFEGTEGIILRIRARGLPAGPRGMHFHAIGTCEDPEAGFKATGPHIMPSGKPHGFYHPDGPHEGNLPNLIVHTDGSADVELYTSLVTMSEGAAALLDGDGSTLIIHESQDDHLTQPIGGAGGRIACGVIRRP